MTTSKKTTATTSKSATEKTTKEQPAAAKTKASTEPKTVATTEMPNPDAPEKEEKKPPTPGVRAMKTRPYIAGKIIAKHGLDAGVTKEMVEELDKEYGLANPTESLFCLRNAWHAASGYSRIEST